MNKNLHFIYKAVFGGWEGMCFKRCNGNYHLDLGEKPKATHIND